MLQQEHLYVMQFYLVIQLCISALSYFSFNTYDWEKDLIITEYYLWLESFTCVELYQFLNFIS